LNLKISLHSGFLG